MLEERRNGVGRETELQVKGVGQWLAGGESAPAYAQ